MELESTISFGAQCVQELTAAKKAVLSAGGQWGNAQIAEVIDRLYAKETPKRKAAPKAKPYSQMGDEEFVEAMEKEPLMKGVDVRRELGKCQFWCNTNGARYSRARAVKWLMKADRDLKVNCAGQSSFNKSAPPPSDEPANWKEWARENAMDATVADRPWYSMDRAGQNYIREQLKNWKK